MASLSEEIRQFLSLHHRLESLSAEERALYESLRERLRLTLTQVQPPRPR